MGRKRKGTGIGNVGKIAGIAKQPNINQPREGNRFSFRLNKQPIENSDCSPQDIETPDIDTRGRALGSLVLYDADQIKSYPSAFQRYDRSLGLQPSAIVEETDSTRFQFCSHRSPVGYWEVSILPLQLCADGGCGTDRGRAILFDGISEIDQRFTVNVEPAIASGVIQIFLWNTTPNYAMTGRLWYDFLPLAGGTFRLTIPANSGIQGLSFFAIDGSGFYRGMCLSFVGTAITLHGWT